MTVINWERIGKAAGKGFLFFLEYCIKISAFVVTGVVLATNGSFGAKLGTGFSSISPTLRGLFEKAGEIPGIATMIHDFNVMSTNAFQAKHGVNAVNSVFAYLDGGIVYVQTVMNNFANQPFSTFLAAFLSFGSLFMLGLVLRFARQKGQGSHFNRLERKLSERIYAGSNRLTNPTPKTNPSSSSNSNSVTGSRSKSGIRTRSGSRFGSAAKSNSTSASTSNSNSNSGTSSKASYGSELSSQLNGNGNGASDSGRMKPSVSRKSQSPNSFKKAQKTNKHLENYIKSVQSGG